MKFLKSFFIIIFMAAFAHNSFAAPVQAESVEAEENKIEVTLSGTGDAIIIGNEHSREKMTELFLNGASFTGKFKKEDSKDKKTYATQDDTISNPWLLPNNILNAKKEPAPADSFYKANNDIFVSQFSKEKDNRKWIIADINYMKSVVKMEALSKELENYGKVFSYSVLDGQEGDVITTVPRNTFYINMIQMLMGPKAVNIATKDNIFDGKQLKKETTILIVPSEKTRISLTEIGYHAVTFEGYIPTPEHIGAVAEGVVSAAEKIVKQAAKPAEKNAIAVQKGKELKESLTKEKQKDLKKNTENI